MKRLIFLALANVSLSANAISFSIGPVRVNTDHGPAISFQPSKPADVVPIVMPGIPVGVDPKDVGKKAGQLADALHDIVTFGDHGRQRDTERANAEESKAQVFRDGQANTKKEKQIGLQRNIDQATEDVQEWQAFIDLSPKAIAFQDQVVAMAQKELQSRTALQANLRAAKNSNSNGSASVLLITSLLSHVDKTGDPNKDRSQMTERWDKSVDQLTEVAKNSNQSTELFITNAISEGSEQSLQDMVQQIGGLRATFQAMLDTANDNLQKAKTRKDGFDKELAALK